MSSENNRHTLLLVEDEALIAMAEKMALEKHGYTVITANSGEKAVEAIKESPLIDLVLMDVDLGSGIDGVESAEIILKKHDIPIIFMSSHTEPEVVEKTEKITSYGYIVKNSGITVLDASIKMAFKLFNSNRKLKRTMDKLEATLNTLPDLLFEIGLDGRYYDIHTPHEELLFKPAMDLKGKNIYSILPTEPAKIIMEAIKEAHETGFASGKQYELQVPAGLRTFEISVSPIASSLTDPHFIFLARDITYRKQTERALRENENKYRTVFMMSPDAVTISTMDGIYVDVNESFTNLSGYSRQEAIGTSVSALKIWCDPEKRAEFVRRLRDKGFVDKMEAVFQSRNGSFITTLLSARIIEINNSPHILAVTRDITAQKKIENAIKESEERYRGIFAHTSSGVAVYEKIQDGKDFIFIDLNRRGKEIENVHRENIAGKKVTTIFPKVKEFGILDALYRVWETGTPENIPVKLYKNGCIEEWIQNYIYRLSSGEIVHVFDDLTEQKQADEKIKRLLEEKELSLKQQSDE